MTTQAELARKHGTPEEFKKAVYAAVPGDISVAEAEKAVREYQAEWDAADDKEAE